MGSQSAREVPCYFIVLEHYCLYGGGSTFHMRMDVPNKKRNAVYVVCGGWCAWNVEDGLTLSL